MIYDTACLDVENPEKQIVTITIGKIQYKCLRELSERTRVPLNTLISQAVDYFMVSLGIPSISEVIPANMEFYREKMKDYKPY